MADEKPAEDVKTPELDFSTLDEEQETPKDPSPEAEPEKAEKPKEPVAEKEEAKVEKPKAEPEKETEEPKAEEPKVEETKPLGKGEERKVQLNEEIRDLVSKRNALRDEVTKANAEVYAPASETDLLGEQNPDTGQNYSATEAKVEALRQAIVLRDYNDKVAEAQLTIESEAIRVLQDFPIFNPENEHYDKELTEEAAELLEANLIKDENSGQIIGSNVMPYQLYKTLARASGISAARGQIKGQEETEKMLANTDNSSSTPPPTKPKDPLFEILQNWDEV
jgi:hypothetical protein